MLVETRFKLLESQQKQCSQCLETALAGNLTRTSCTITPLQILEENLCGHGTPLSPSASYSPNRNCSEQWTHLMHLAAGKVRTW